MIKKITFYTLRPAIAMIELIFAIVVMGIVMMSAPMLLSTSSNSAIVVIQQEAIAEASTQANIIMGHYWDENNITASQFPVLYTTDGDTDLNVTIAESGKPPRRIGTPDTSFRVFKSGGGNEYNASTIGADVGDTYFDDMDDFDGYARNLVLEETSAKDYIERTTVLLTSNVTYIRDTEGSGTYQNPGTDNNLTFDLNTTAMGANQSTNIKHIQVTLTSTSGIADLNKSITLHAFSCNIGRYKLVERP